MTFGGVEFNAEVTLSCRIIVIQMKVQTNVKKVREQFVDSILSPNNTSVHMKISRWTESTENMSHANWLQCAQLLNTIQCIIYKIAAAAQPKQINWIQNERKRKKKKQRIKWNQHNLAGFFRSALRLSLFIDTIQWCVTEFTNILLIFFYCCYLIDDLCVTRSLILSKCSKLTAWWCCVQCFVLVSHTLSTTCQICAFFLIFHWIVVVIDCYCVLILHCVLFTDTGI